MGILQKTLDSASAFTLSWNNTGSDCLEIRVPFFRILLISFQSYKSVCLSISNLILLIIFYSSAWPTYTSNIWIATGLSVLAINTWVLPFKHLGPNGPSWTICTLFFWYWCFPLILPRVQRLTNKQLAHGIVHYFWLNIAVSILIVAGLGAYFGREVNF